MLCAALYVYAYFSKLTLTIPLNFLNVNMKNLILKKMINMEKLNKDVRPIIIRHSNGNINIYCILDDLNRDLEINERMK